MIRAIKSCFSFLSFPHMYLRQSTADSTSSDSLDVGWNMCKRNIEEEEAEALAKVRSMVTEQMPHPPLSGLIPPNPEVLIHVQPSKDGKKEVRVRTPPFSGHCFQNTSFSGHHFSGHLIFQDIFRTPHFSGRIQDTSFFRTPLYRTPRFSGHIHFQDTMFRMPLFRTLNFSGHYFSGTPFVRTSHFSGDGCFLLGHIFQDFVQNTISFLGHVIFQDTLFFRTLPC